MLWCIMWFCEQTVASAKFKDQSHLNSTGRPFATAGLLPWSTQAMIAGEPILSGGNGESMGSWFASTLIQQYLTDPIDNRSKHVTDPSLAFRA